MVNILVESGRAAGSQGDDILRLISHADTGGESQIHSFAMQGDDLTIMSFADISIFAHGVHARGDAKGIHTGHDIFRFENIENVNNGGLVVGRLEDFDYSRDTIEVNGKAVSLKNLSEHSNISVVSYNGAYLGNLMDEQQWLRIETPTGGNILYALEGARILPMNLGVNEHLHSAASNDQERHFPYINEVPNIDALEVVSYIDQMNVVPFGEASVNGLVINDVDTVMSDVMGAIVEGGALDDLIAAGLNDDSVNASDGDDKVWGGSGHDKIEGGAGEDTLIGGTGNDTIWGEIGDDLIYVSYGDDVVYGGGGSDWTTSDGSGYDKFDGGAGSYDSVSYSQVAGEGVVISLLTKSGNAGLALGDTYENVENLTGTSWADVIAGDQDRNILRGLAGNDKLSGNGGNDRIVGGKGDDLIDGGGNYDYAVFSGNLEEFDIRRTETGLFVEDTNFENGDEGLDHLHRVEVLVFDDSVLFVDDLIF